MAAKSPVDDQPELEAEPDVSHTSPADETSPVSAEAPWRRLHKREREQGVGTTQDVQNDEEPQCDAESGAASSSLTTTVESTGIPRAFTSGKNLAQVPPMPQFHSSCFVIIEKYIFSIIRSKRALYRVARGHEKPSGALAKVSQCSDMIVKFF